MLDGPSTPCFTDPGEPEPGHLVPAGECRSHRPGHRVHHVQARLSWLADDPRPATAIAVRGQRAWLGTATGVVTVLHHEDLTTHLEVGARVELRRHGVLAVPHEGGRTARLLSVERVTDQGPASGVRLVRGR